MHRMNFPVFAYISLYFRIIGTKSQFFLQNGPISSHIFRLSRYAQTAAPIVARYFCNIFQRNAFYLRCNLCN